MTRRARWIKRYRAGLLRALEDCSNLHRSFELQLESHLPHSQHLRLSPPTRTMAAFAAAPALSSKAFFGKTKVTAKVRSTKAPRAAFHVSAAKKSVGDLKEADLKGKTVFIRCDLNVPMDKDMKITDDTRIRAAIPTLEYLVKNGAKVLVTSHLVSAGPEPVPEQTIPDKSNATSTPRVE